MSRKGGGSLIVDKIKALCKAEGVTIKAVEEICNLGNGTIKRWDKSSPSVDRIARVARFFRVTIDELIKED
jgi:transcriptional regulator with XRE-family HTH domain